MKLRYNHEKISTDILGLDKLLFGGVLLQEQEVKKTEKEKKEKEEQEDKTPLISQKELVITISGKSGTSRALLAMQLLHGITKNMRKLALKDETESGVLLSDPVFLSDSKNKNNLEDMVLDTLISKCVNSIIEDNLSEKHKWDDCKFCSTVFKLNDCEVAKKDINYAKMDLLLSEEVIVYNNRTNALHSVLPQGKDDENNCNDISNLIAPRISNEIIDYCKTDIKNNLDYLADEFFPIQITNPILKDIKRISLEKYIPCLVLGLDWDKDDGPSLKDNKDKEYIKKMRNKSLVTIFVLDEDQKPLNCEPDLILELRAHEDEINDYVRHELCIRKSVLQTTALGWHRYKKRDYGIEIYPSVHVLLQRRRHMPKALLRGYSDVLTDTYQQFIDNNPDKDNYEAYLDGKTDLHWNRLKTIYRTLQEEQNICKLLKSILLEPRQDNDEIDSQVTVIIGEPNSYKRYLSLGGTFSASCRQEHTLNLLFDQEYYTMRKRLICPTWAFKANKNRINCEALSPHCDRCQKKCRLPYCQMCYKFIHFWDLRMDIFPLTNSFIICLDKFVYFPRVAIRKAELNVLLLMIYRKSITASHFLKKILYSCRH